tara:strand:+ start:1001 stop:1486 length:486 start_codon:yes stop_codon:yes gene_type:complete
MAGNTLLLSEVLDLVAKAKTKEKKIQTLREHNSDSLRMILKSSFDPDIEWLLPQGEVPFIPNDAPAGTEHNVLAYESRKLYHYIRGGNNTLSQNKRESMFVQLLEGLHESEADLIIAAKDKVLHQKYKGLSANVVREAFNWDDNFMVEEVIYPQTPGPANG